MSILIFVCICFRRYYGRKILHIVYDHPEFEKLVSKHVPSSLQKNVRDTVENLRTKVSNRYTITFACHAGLLFYCVTNHTDSTAISVSFEVFLVLGTIDLITELFSLFFHRVSAIPPRAYLLPGSESRHPAVGAPEVVGYEDLWHLPHLRMLGTNRRILLLFHLDYTCRKSRYK